MKSVVPAYILMLALFPLTTANAGKVPVIPGNSLGLSGITIPSGTTSAPSPAAPATVSATPSVSLPASVVNVINTTTGDAGPTGAAPTITVPQTVTAVTTLTNTASFTPGQASQAISKINSILSNVDLTPKQAEQMIQLREAMEQRLSPEPTTK